jgi:FixJ family two-component response regulator
MSAPSGTLVGIVDDDPSVRKGLARLVKGAGYRVEVFASAREFLARPQQEDPSSRVFALVVTGMLNRQVAAELGRVEKP